MAGPYALLLFCQFVPKLPGALLVVVAGILVSYAAGLSEHGVAQRPTCSCQPAVLAVGLANDPRFADDVAGFKACSIEVMVARRRSSLLLRRDG